jgi:hypothetical protein
VKDIDLQRVGESVGAALVELARYHRGELEQLEGLSTDMGDLAGGELTKAWTRAQIDFLDARVSKAGLRTVRERAAALRLPPDLVGLGSDGELVVHVERETRGWEWNDIFGALVKVTFANPQPAPIAVLVLDCVPEGSGLLRRLDLLLEVARRLLSATPQVQRFYLVVLGRGDWAGVLEVFRQGAAGGEIVQRWLLAISGQGSPDAEPSATADRGCM